MIAKKQKQKYWHFKEEENHRATGPELVLPEFGSPVCIYPISLYLALGDRRERPPERL